MLSHQVETLGRELEESTGTNATLAKELILSRQREAEAKSTTASMTSAASIISSQSGVPAISTPRTSKYSSSSSMSDVVAFSPSWTPNTTRSNFESASISNEILRDNQRLLEGSVDDKDREISQVLLMSYLLLLLLLSLNCLFFFLFFLCS